MATKIGKTVRNNLVVGLILITPIVVTLLVGQWLFQFTADIALRFFPRTLRDTYPLLFSRITAFAVVALLLFFVGLLARNFIGRRLYQFGDALLRRVPLLNKIYISVRQISEALLAQSQYLFKEVVLLEYPRKGVFVLGFVTATAPESFVPHTAGKENVSLYRSVFIPTSPNPTSGFVVFVQASELTTLPISVADAMKLVVSGGAVFPGTSLPDDRPTLLDKLEEWIRRQSLGESVAPADRRSLHHT